MDDRSKVLKFGGFRWDGIPVREYKTGDVPYRGVTRQTLLGEGVGEQSFNFVTRYFEIQPGGYSTLERHQHPHAVVVIRGRGRVWGRGAGGGTGGVSWRGAGGRPPWPGGPPGLAPRGAASVSAPGAVCSPSCLGFPGAGGCSAGPPGPWSPETPAS